jgi:hypothetical protein
MRRNILTIAGLLCVAFGALFLLQGLGVIRWPASSMMIDQRAWVVRGAVVALIGVLLLGVRWVRKR